MDCSRGCLYNLTADITEHSNLAEALPATVASMRARIIEINATAFSPHRGNASPHACKVALENNHGFWCSFFCI